MKTKQIHIRRLLPVLLVFCLLAVLAVGLSVSASALQSSYTAGEIPNTTGGGQTADDPVKVNRFEELKAALEHNGIRYVELTGIEKVSSSDAKGQQSLPYEITSPPGMLGNHGIFVSNTKYLKISGEATFIASRDEYGALICVSGGSELHVRGSGYLAYCHDDSRSLIQVDGGRLYIEGSVRLRAEAGSRKDTNVYLPAVLAYSYSDATAYVNISGNPVLEGSVYEDNSAQLLEDKNLGTNMYNYRGAVELIGNVQAEISGGTFRAGSLKKRPGSDSVYYQSFSQPVGLRVARSVYDGVSYTPTVTLTGGVYSGIYFHTNDKTKSIGKEFVPAGYVLAFESNGYPWGGRNAGDLKTSYTEMDEYTPDYTFHWTNMEVLNLKDGVEIINQTPAAGSGAGYLDRYVGDSETFSFEASLSAKLKNKGYSVTKIYRFGFPDELPAWESTTEDTANISLTYPQKKGDQEYFVYEGIQLRHASGNTVLYSETCGYEITLHEKTVIPRVAITVEKPYDDEALYVGMNTYKSKFIPKINAVTSGTLPHAADNAPYVIKQFSWRYVGGSSLGASLPSDHVFNAGEWYGVEVILEAKPGYTFSDASYSLGGHFQVSHCSGDMLILRCVGQVDAAIEEIFLQLMHPFNNFSVGSNGASLYRESRQQMSVSANGTQWLKKPAGAADSEYRTMAASETFIDNYDYRCVVTVKASSGYEFRGTPDVIEYGCVPSSETVDVMDRSTVRITFDFLAVAAKMIDATVKIPAQGDKVVGNPANVLTTGYSLVSADYSKYNFVTGSWSAVTSSSAAFAAGGRYKVTLAIDSMAGYAFSDAMLVSINDSLVSDVAVIANPESTGGKRLICSYEFELPYDGASHVKFGFLGATVGMTAEELDETAITDTVWSVPGATGISTSVSWKDAAGGRFDGTFAYGESYTAQFRTTLNGITAVPDGLIVIVDGQRVQYSGTYIPAYGGVVLSYSVAYDLPASPADYEFSILWKEESNWSVFGSATIDANAMKAAYPVFSNPSYTLAYEWYMIDKDGNTVQIPVDGKHIYNYTNYTCYFSPDMGGCQVFAVVKLMFSSEVRSAVKSEIKTVQAWNIEDENLHDGVQTGDIVYPAEKNGLSHTLSVLGGAEYPVKWTWKSLSEKKLQDLEKWGYTVTVYYEKYNAAQDVWNASVIDTDDLVESVGGIHSCYVIAEADTKTRLRIEISDGDENVFETSNELTLVGTPWTPGDVHTNLLLDGAMMGVNPDATPFKTAGEDHSITFMYQLPKVLLNTYEAEYRYKFNDIYYDTIELNGAGYTVTPVCTADGKEVEGVLADLGNGLFSYTVNVNDSRSPYAYSVALHLDITDPSGAAVLLPLPENRVSMLLLAVDNFTSGHKVSGTVTSFADGPVTVVLLDEASNPAYSAVANGASADYAIVGVPDGTYTMCVTKDNYGQYVETVTVAGEDVVVDVTLIQTSGFGTFTYYGTVSGEGDGEMRITLSNTDMGYHKSIAGTGNSLAFSFADLQPGTYAVYAQKGSLVAYDSSIIIENADVEEHIELQSEYVPDTHRIAGTVLATEVTAAPIVIMLKQGDTVIAADNDNNNWWTSFEFTNLEKGEYTLTVEKLGHTAVKLTVNITEESETLINLGTVTLDSIHRVLGTVKSEAGTNPVTVTLTPAGADEPARTFKYTPAADSFEYSWNDVPCGEYVLRVERIGYLPYSADVSVKDTVDIHVPAITLIPVPTYTVSGTVSSKSGTAPVTVDLIPVGKTEPIKTTTAAELTAAFSWTGIPAGEYVIRAAKEGYVTQSVSVTVADANVTVPEIKLVAASTVPTVYTVSGTVKSASGTDATTVKLYAVGAADPLKTAAGTELTVPFSWNDIPAGKYVLRVEKNGYQTQNIDVTVTNANVEVPAVTLVPVAAGTNVSVNCVGAIPHTVSGQAVTVKHDAACRVGYLEGGKYVAITPTANGDGSYTFTAPAGVTEVLLVVKGDVNGDGKVNTSDYGRLNATLLGKVTLASEASFAADANGDGKVNTSDYGRMNAVLLGKTALTW